jgi:hypothetical protein
MHLSKTSVALRILLLLGGIMALIGSHHWYRLLRALAPTTVEDCRTHYFHGWQSRLQLADGSVLYLSFEDVENPERCLPRGAQIEKRIGESGYRINGRLYVSAPATSFAWLSAAGVALVVAGLCGLLWRRLARRVRDGGARGSPQC